MGSISGWFVGEEGSEEEQASMLSNIFGDAEPQSAVSSALTVSRTQRLKYFTTLTLLGILFLVLSTFFLPLIAIRPHKFALLLTLGNLCIWLAIAFLRGPYEQL